MANTQNTNTKDNIRANLINIAQRAAHRKAMSSLRHMPTASDLQTASQNAQLMANPQYHTITEDKE